jgi:ESS family glutamate:Na+ symporter
VFLINQGIRRGWLAPKERKAIDGAWAKSGVYAKGSKLPVGSLQTTDTEAIDTLSVNLGVTLAVYLGTWSLLTGLTALLSLVGPMGRELAVNLWALSFVLSSVLALGARWLMERMRVAHVLDGGSLTRISGASVDILVTASLAAISLVVVAQHWLPIVVLGLIGGLFTGFYVLWLSSRLYDEHQFQEAMIIYGGSTGTLPTGLALLRIIDPQYSTSAAMDYMYGSGVAFFLGIPMILAINLPVTGYLQHRPEMYWYLIGILMIYVVALGTLYWVIARRRAFASPLRAWYRPGR